MTATLAELAQRLTLSPAEAGALTGIGLRTIMEAIHGRGLVAMQPTPHRYRVNREDLDEWRRRGHADAGGQAPEGGTRRESEERVTLYSEELARNISHQAFLAWFKANPKRGQDSTPYGFFLAGWEALMNAQTDALRLAVEKLQLLAKREPQGHRDEDGVWHAHAGPIASALAALNGDRVQAETRRVRELEELARSAIPLLWAACEAGLRGDNDGVASALETILATEECLDRMSGQWCHFPKGHRGPHSWNA